MKDRIKKIMDSEDLSAARFADRLEINRAVVSHILNGRNNPSLDVVTKILSEMNYINPDWLLQGIGSMYKDGYSGKQEIDRSLFHTEAINTGEDTDETEYAEEKSLKNVEKASKSVDNEGASPVSMNDRQVRQIIVYYDDNTFETFKPH